MVSIYSVAGHEVVETLIHNFTHLIYDVYKFVFCSKSIIEMLFIHGILIS